MQENTFSGEEIITPNVTGEEAARAALDRRNREVKLFYPGRIAVLPTGQRVVRGEDGKWYRILGEASMSPVLPREDAGAGA